MSPKKRTEPKGLKQENLPVNHASRELFPLKKVLILAVVLLCLPVIGWGIPISDPSQIEVTGMVSLGNTGAAWLKIDNRELLVSPGYVLTRDLRVTAVKHEGVIMYQEQAKRYHSLAPSMPDDHHHHHSHCIWCMPIPLWKAIRMVALAYGKDYICHAETRMQIMPRAHVRNMEEMLDHCTTPHHRHYGRAGIIYVSPVHVRNADWRWFLQQVRIFQSPRLTLWHPSLAEKGTIISDGRDLADVLAEIEAKTKVKFLWDKPFPVPIYCSLKDRPWHEILETILIYNDFSVAADQNALRLTCGWQ